MSSYSSSAVAPAATAALPRYRPDVVLWAVAVAVVMNLWRIPQIVPALAVTRPTILTTLVALGIYLLDRHPARSFATLFTPLTLPLVALAALMFAGIPTSLDPWFSSAYLSKEVLPRLFLVLLIVGSVRDRQDLDWLLGTVLAGAWIYTLYVLWKIPLGPEGKWVKLIEYDNNDFAMLAVATVPLGLYFARPDARRRQKIFGLATVALMLLVVVRSGSRGGFLGLLATLAYLGARYSAVPVRTRLLTIALGAVAIVVLGGTSYRDKMATILHPKEDYNWAGNDYDGRMSIWKRGIGYMESHPVLGVGINAFTLAEGELSQVARDRLAHGKSINPLVAHNMYVQVGAELGVTGLVLFLLVLYRSFRSLARVRRAYRGATPPLAEFSFAQALTASLLGYSLCAIFIAGAYFTYLFVLFAMIAALTKVAPAWMPRRVLAYGAPSLPWGDAAVVQQSPR